ncbi:DUF2510 domain-containing protein [Schumannella soli]|uniref:DUF2510 domain-containing protein n=1 Tax=Schumannella soli TaxID=2590779 RepID=A0A506XYL9_9MICO|nr:DUF2510 domain-containing protein [Schumannella soli]TPW78024.1 DUF2510 domain-containing protein [Schumannella soli]
MSDERQQAGWYPDPSGARQLRWWNGHAFTDLVSDAEDEEQNEVADALLIPAPVEPVIAEPIATAPIASAPVAPATPAAAPSAASTFRAPEMPLEPMPLEPMPLPLDLDLPAPAASERIGGGLLDTLDTAALADFEAQLAADFSAEAPVAPEPTIASAHHEAPAAPAAPAFAGADLDAVFDASFGSASAAGALTLDEEIAQLLGGTRRR